MPWDLLGSSTMDYCLQFNRHCGGSSTRAYDFPILIYIFRDQSLRWRRNFYRLLSLESFFARIENGKFVRPVHRIIVIRMIPSL